MYDTIVFNGVTIPANWSAGYDEGEEGHAIIMGTANPNDGRYRCHHRIVYRHGLYEGDGDQFAEADAIAMLIEAAPSLLRERDALREALEMVKYQLAQLVENPAGASICNWLVPNPADAVFIHNAYQAALAALTPAREEGKHE